LWSAPILNDKLTHMTWLSYTTDKYPKIPMNFQQTYNVDVEYVGVIINQGWKHLDEMVSNSV